MLNRDKLLKKIQTFEEWESLTNCQKTFLIQFCRGDNIFLTGKAGVGKSHCLNFLFKVLEKEGIFFGKTATTGIAALNIGGSTLHQFCGIGLGDGDISEIFKRVFRNKKAIERLRFCQILFIDEISMCSGDLLDIVDKVFKGVRRNKAPFGGVQLVLVGDLLQLPPVFKNDNNPIFCFEAESWQKANIKVIELNEIVRQKNDSDFAKLLNNIREGDVKSIELLTSRVNAKLNSGKIKPLKLFCRNISVDKYNEACLSNIKGQLFSWKALDTGEQHHIDYFNRNCLAPQVLNLKLGAQVMLLRNIDVDAGLVNGSLGIVKSIQNNLPEIEFANGEKVIVGREDWEIKEQVVTRDFNGKEIVKYRTLAKRSQIPLKLAFAATIHKMQGQTIDFADIDLSDAFETGQVYTALSRVRDLESLTLRPFSLDKIKVNKKCLQFYKNK